MYNYFPNTHACIQENVLFIYKIFIFIYNIDYVFIYLQYLRANNS